MFSVTEHLYEGHIRLSSMKNLGVPFHIDDGCTWHHEQFVLFIVFGNKMEFFSSYDHGQIAAPTQKSKPGREPLKSAREPHVG